MMDAGIEPNSSLSGFAIKQHRLIPKRMNNSQLEGCAVKCSVCSNYVDGCVTRIYLVYYTERWMVSNSVYNTAVYACSLECANFFIFQRMGL